MPRPFPLTPPLSLPPVLTPKVLLRRFTGDGDDDVDESLDLALFLLLASCSSCNRRLVARALSIWALSALTVLAGDGVAMFGDGVAMFGASLLVALATGTGTFLAMPAYVFFLEDLGVANAGPFSTLPDNSMMFMTSLSYAGDVLTLTRSS